MNIAAQGRAVERNHLIGAKSSLQRPTAEARIQEGMGSGQLWADRLHRKLEAGLTRRLGMEEETTMVWELNSEAIGFTQIYVAKFSTTKDFVYTNSTEGQRGDFKEFDKLL